MICVFFKAKNECKAIVIIITIPPIIVWTLGCSLIISHTQIGPSITSNRKNKFTSGAEIYLGAIVTNTKGIEKLGNWSPDGEWIVYSVIVGDEDKVGIFKKNPDGVDEVRLTENFEDHNPIWSPDGERIAFLSTRGSDDLDIYTLNIESNEETSITASQGNDFDFSWDPSGKRITFVSEREDNPEIFVIDISVKQEPIRLTDNESVEYSPLWKENKIIFISNSDGDNDIYSMTPSDGSNQKRLTETSQNETEIFW